MAGAWHGRGKQPVIGSHCCVMLTELSLPSQTLSKCFERVWLARLHWTNAVTAGSWHHIPSLLRVMLIEFKYHLLYHSILHTLKDIRHVCRVFSSSYLREGAEVRIAMKEKMEEGRGHHVKLQHLTNYGIVSKPSDILSIILSCWNISRLNMSLLLNGCLSSFWNWKFNFWLLKHGRTHSYKNSISHYGDGVHYFMS